MSANSDERSEFVALSRFIIKNEMREAVCEAFRAPAPGRRRARIRPDEVLGPPENDREIWLMTFWNDETSFRTWHRSPAYQESHKEIPKCLKLVPQSAELRFFEHICS